MCVENKTIAGIDSTLDALMYGSGGGLPCESSAVTIEFESIYEIVCLFVRTDELDHSEELLVSGELLLLLQHQHKVVGITRLNHNPIHSSAQIDICCQKDNVFALKCGYALVLMH